MLGEKDTESEAERPSCVDIVAIYGSLSTEDSEDAEDYQLHPDKLPRGVIIGTVQLFDCDAGEWKLREPRRLATSIKQQPACRQVRFHPFGRERARLVPTSLLGWRLPHISQTRSRASTVAIWHELLLSCGSERDIGQRRPFGRLHHSWYAACDSATGRMSGA